MHPRSCRRSSRPPSADRGGRGRRPLAGRRTEQSHRTPSGAHTPTVPFERTFMRRRWIAAGLLALLALMAAACGSNTTGAEASSSGGTTADVSPGKDSEKVGFIFVGPKDDFGYNQAAYEGSQAVKAAFPDMEVLTAENVPEDDNATRIMESMIDDGARIIFATSYGHLDPALKVAEANPDVVVVQQGNFIKTAIPANVGTYFGTVYEPVYLAGIAAGKSTASNKL